MKWSEYHHLWKRTEMSDPAFVPVRGADANEVASVILGMVKARHFVVKWNNFRFHGPATVMQLVFILSNPDTGLKCTLCSKLFKRFYIHGGNSWSFKTPLSLQHCLVRNWVGYSGTQTVKNYTNGNTSGKMCYQHNYICLTFGGHCTLHTDTELYLKSSFLAWFLLTFQYVCRYAKYGILSLAVCGGNRHTPLSIKSVTAGWLSSRQTNNPNLFIEPVITMWKWILLWV